jgi:hypothetical protein
MSIEQALADLTAAIDVNTVALRKAAAPVAAPLAPDAPAAGTGKPGRPKKSAETAAAAAGPSAKDAADAVLGLANDKDYGRDYAVKVLAEFGVQRLSDLKPDRYAEAIAAVAKIRATAKQAPADTDSLV